MVEQVAHFDVWLQKSLQHLYDGALDETVPEELLLVLQETSEQPRSC